MRYLIKVFLLGIMAMLSACESDGLTKETGNKEKHVESVNVIEELQSLDGTNQKKVVEKRIDTVYKISEPLESTSENDELLLSEYRQIIRSQEDKIDSLLQVTNENQTDQSEFGESNETVLENSQTYSTSEKEIFEMVRGFHSAWQKLPQSKNVNEVLSFFNEKYAVSRIFINSNNEAQVARHSHLDFKKVLKDELSSIKKKEYQFGKEKFLDVETLGGKYFNVTYKCHLEERKEGTLRATSSLLVMLTGKKEKGSWKISSYSGVNFKILE